MALSNRDLEQDVPHHDDDNDYNTSSRNMNGSSNGKMHQRNGSDDQDRASNSSSQQQQQQQQQQQLSCRLGPETFSYEPNAAANDPSKSNSSISHGLSSLCKPTSSIPRTLLLATVYASISGLLFGYQMGVTGGALHSLQSTLSLTSSQAESVSGFFFLGLMIASPFGGYACDRLGRRSTILYMDGAFAVAAAIMAVAPNYDASMSDRAAALEAEMRNPSPTRLDETRVPLEYGEASFFVMDDVPPISHYWRQAVIVAFLAVAEQFCGHINIINYAPVIFAEVFYNYDEEQAAENDGAIASELLSTTIILGVVKFIVTTLVLFEVDKLGRRFLLKAGAGIVTLSLLFLAVGFSVAFEETVVDESGEELVHTKYQKELVLIGCTGVVAGFALSYGPITWLVTAELSPSSIRGRMLGFYQVLTHGCAALVSYTFLSGQEKRGMAYPFWLYFGCSAVSFVFIWIAVPETGGVAGGDGEDVESLLDDTRFWSKDNPIVQFGNKIGCIGSCVRTDKKTNEEMGRIDSCFDDVEGPVGGRGSFSFALT